MSRRFGRERYEGAMARAAAFGEDAVEACREEWNGSEPQGEEDECPTCLGHGRIRDGETLQLRKCLDCNGSGSR